MSSPSGDPHKGHIIPLVDLTRETLDWFDRYLGEVR